MFQKPYLMNKGNMIAATYRAKDRVNDWIELVEKVTNDTDKAKRLERNWCKACHYSSHLGGCAMTTRPCMNCEKDVGYGSTNTDVLCLDCAKQLKLCKHCGGDLEMRIRRKEWPEKKDTNGNL